MNSVQTLRNRSKSRKMAFWLALVVGFFWTIQSVPAVAAGIPATSLTVKLNNAMVAAYAINDLEQMPQATQAYTSLDSMPAPNMTAARGVNLAAILTAAGIPIASVQSITFKSTDGYTLPLTGQYLFGATRYYYPNLTTHWDLTNQCVTAGALDGGVQAEPLLALFSYTERLGASPRFDLMDGQYALRLCFGQDPSNIMESTSGKFAKWVSEIDVSTSPPALTPPALTADTTDNTVGQAVGLTFTDNPGWRSAITGITVGGTGLSPAQYAVAAGTITLNAGVFPAAGDYPVVISATGYAAAAVTQRMEASVPPATPELAALTLSGNPILTYTGTPVTYNLGGLTLAGADQYGNAFNLAGLTAGWSVTSGTATVAGGTLTITGSGIIGVQAAIGGITSNNFQFIVGKNGGGPNTGLPDQITLSWTSDPKTTQTIAWRTGGDTGQDQVQYLPAAGFSGGFAGAQAATAAGSGLYSGHSHFEVTLQSLAPGSSYVYRVGREGAWSGPYTFTTAAVTDKFSFLYMGDVQQGYGYWGVELQNAVAANPGLKFGILGGDLVDDSDSSNWQQFFAAARDTYAQLPLMPTVGNHDDNDLFWNTFALPQNGPDGYKEKFYSFDYGNCHIAVLDSNCLSPAGIGDYDLISAWLKNDLNNSDRQWKFLVFHYPPYPAAYDSHAASLQANWVPIFEQCGVDAVFVGHQHVYMRTKPIRDGQVQAAGNGIVYVMGNSSTKYYGAGPNYDYIAKELANVSNYQVISIDGDTMTMTAKNAVGQVIDSFSLTKQPQSGHAVYTVSPTPDAAYRIGATPDGISTMTVNSGFSGLKYFGAGITPVKPHDGLETVVFTHQRSGNQLSINVTKADFDLVNAASAGFNVQPGDIVKVYIVDQLTNALDFNPTILQ